ncbi:sensor histidine kinase [Planctobacterium marinum]|uniref:sensor histidine kinase n=1 Tax=Planctobacterium marinum TaxID=1631968 RepID=UPI001E2E0764|nr:histidine kinase [Planctobacterium marinum]MCC2604060.1 histidine kinase [Planctobacterium marinum]
MKDAIARLKNWRIWTGSTLVLLIQALFSFNLKFHAEHIYLQDLNSLFSAAGLIGLWYLPAMMVAPFIVAFAPLTRVQQQGWLVFFVFNGIYVLATTILVQLLSISLLHFTTGQDWQQGDIVGMMAYFYRNTPWHADSIMILALFALGYALDYSQRLRSKEIQAEKLKVELVSAELQALKAQLNPHFLFNVLNGISGLVRVGRSDEATDALSDLSSMLRTILENRDQEMVTVKSELAFIELYLALQQLRFNDKLDVNISAQEDVMAVRVPFMVLQPLVENAIHHGAQLDINGNLIQVKLFIQDNKLHFELLNKVPGTASESGFGIGIGNNRARLEKIYGNDFSLELKALPEQYFLTRLSVPTGEGNA